MQNYVLVVLALAATARPAQQQGDTTDSDITDGCKAYTVLAQLQDDANAMARKLHKQNKEADSRRRLYMIAAERADSVEERCLLAAIAASAAVQQTHLESEYETARSLLQEGIEAIQALAQTAAAAAALEKIQYQNHGTAGKKIDTNNVAIRLKVSGGEAKTCEATNDAGERKINGKTVKPAKHAKLKTVKPSEIAAALYTPALKITAASSSCSDDGSAWKAWATAAAACGTAPATTNNPLHFTEPALAGKAELETLSIYTDDDPAKDCKESNSITGTDDESIKKHAHKLCISTKIRVPAGATTALTGTELSNNPTVQAMARGCLPAFAAKTKMEPRDVESLKFFLKTAYGKSESAFKTKFKPLVEDAYVQVLRAGKLQSVKIESINTPEEEHDALNRLRAKQTAARRAASQNPSTPDQKESADKTGEKKDGGKETGVNCSSHSTSDACTNGQNCKWENNA
uniref:Variant surface glycoprotein 1125.1197 n=1 Tax=Trypanosoma brucei TaxID=5691 RepID=A0A1J0R6F2_9TRYP|nr:variant surface glycoprotein 1125.1197 [Trypanosoma brucei]